MKTSAAVIACAFALSSIAVAEEEPKPLTVGQIQATQGDPVDPVEHDKKMREDDGVCRGDSLSGERKVVDPEELVSMNFWVFPASFIGQIKDHFAKFIAERGTELKSECYIPTVVDELIHNGKADCRVIKTTANWLGVTYPSDKPAVVDSIAKLVEQGVYPAKLG